MADDVRVVTEKHKPAIDMAVLAGCDHMVMTVGTFGWWAAYLGADAKGGEVVYYDSEFKMEHPTNKGNVVFEDYYPEGWIAMGAWPPATRVIASNETKHPSPLRPVTRCMIPEDFDLRDRGHEVKKLRDAGWKSAKRFFDPAGFRRGAHIIDVGSYVGEDLVEFVQKNPKLAADITILTYEPVVSIRAKLLPNVKPYPNIQVSGDGLGDHNYTTCFATTGDATHEVSPDDGRCTENSTIVDVAAVVGAIARIDLLHINCEGCEYRILKRLIDARATDRIDAIEVQFHLRWVTPAQYCEIERGLRSLGYSNVYSFPFVWELWERQQQRAHLPIMPPSAYNAYSGPPTETPRGQTRPPQDKFVWEFLKSRENGTFVELGGYDGVSHSNTLWLEREHGWSGLLIEANPTLCERINRLQRHSWVFCGCLSSTPQQLQFKATGTTGGLLRYRSHNHFSTTKSNSHINVQCQTPSTIFKECFGQTIHIDYFSLDVEGAELQVLGTLRTLLESGVLTVDVWSIEYREWDGTKIVVDETLQNLQGLRSFFKTLGGYTEVGLLSNPSRSNPSGSVSSDEAGLDVIFARERPRPTLPAVPPPPPGGHSVIIRDAIEAALGAVKGKSVSENWVSFQGSEWNSIVKHGIYNQIRCQFNSQARFHILDGYYVCPDGIRTAHSGVKVPSRDASALLNDGVGELVVWDAIAKALGVTYSLHAGASYPFSVSHCTTCRPAFHGTTMWT